MGLPNKEDFRSYRRAVLRHWSALLVFAFFGIWAGIQMVVQQFVGKDIVMPTWLLVALAVAACMVAQFQAWLDMKRDRDLLRRYKVEQDTLSALADFRDVLISHMNKPVETGVSLGMWRSEYQTIRSQINEKLKTSVSYAEHRAFDHLGTFVQYSIPADTVPQLNNTERHDYAHWKSRVIRDHRWLEKFIQDYGRFRPRADLSAVSGDDQVGEQDVGG